MPHAAPLLAGYSAGGSNPPDGAVLRAFLSSQAFARGLIGPRGGGRKVAAVVDLVRRIRLAPAGRWRIAVIAARADDLAGGAMRAVVEVFGADTGLWNLPERTYAVDWTQAADPYPGRRWVEWRFFGLDRPEQRRRLDATPATAVWLCGARDLPADALDLGCELAGTWTEGVDRPALICTSRMPAAAHWLCSRFAEGADVANWRLFRQPGGRDGAAENTRYLRPGFYQRLAQRLPPREVASEVDAGWREGAGFDESAPIDPAKLALACLWHLRGGFPPANTNTGIEGRGA